MHFQTISTILLGAIAFGAIAAPAADPALGARSEQSEQKEQKDQAKQIGPDDITQGFGNQGGPGANLLSTGGGRAFPGGGSQLFSNPGFQNNRFGGGDGFGGNNDQDLFQLPQFLMDPIMQNNNGQDPSQWLYPLLFGQRGLRGNNGNDLFGNGFDGLLPNGIPPNVLRQGSSFSQIDAQQASDRGGYDRNSGRYSATNYNQQPNGWGGRGGGGGFGGPGF